MVFTTRAVRMNSPAESPFHFERHLLRKIAMCHGSDDAGDFRGGLDQIGDQTVDGFDTGVPVSAGGTQGRPLADPSFLSDGSTDAPEFVGHVFIELEDVVQDIRDLTARQPD